MLGLGCRGWVWQPRHAAEPDSTARRPFQSRSLPSRGQVAGTPSSTGANRGYPERRGFRRLSRVAVAEGAPVLIRPPPARSGLRRYFWLCALLMPAAMGCTDAGTDDPVASSTPLAVETVEPTSPPSTVPPTRMTSEAVTSEPATLSPTPTASLPSSPNPTVAESFAPTDDPAPALMLTDEDFDVIVRSHEAYRDWLYGHPDPDLLAAIYHPDCECYADESRLLGHYEDQGQWWISDPTSVVSVEVVDDFAADVRVLHVIRERVAPSMLVDASGTVHETLAPKPPNLERNTFVRADSSSPWLLRSFIDLGQVGDADGE